MGHDADPNELLEVADDELGAVARGEPQSGRGNFSRARRKLISTSASVMNSRISQSTR
jgi:hypothetical protein